MILPQVPQNGASHEPFGVIISSLTYSLFCFFASNIICNSLCVIIFRLRLLGFRFLRHTYICDLSLGDDDDDSLHRSRSCRLLKQNRDPFYRRGESHKQNNVYFLTSSNAFLKTSGSSSSTSAMLTTTSCGPQTPL